METSDRVLTVDKATLLQAGGATKVDRETGRRCLNVPVIYCFSQDLTTLETRLDLSQSVDNDADFWWRGLGYFDTGGGNFLRGRCRLLNGYYLANSNTMPWSLLSLRGISPEIKIPAGGVIGIEATNNDVSTRRLKLQFIGVKRFFLD